MTRGVAYSKPLAVAAAAALAGAFVLLWARMATDASLSQARLHAASAEGDLTTRVTAMSAYASENLDALRRQVGNFRVHLGAEDTWEGIVRLVGNGWIAEPGPKEERNGYSVQLGTLKLGSHSVGDWPEIVDTVKALEATPGVGIAEFEMKTSGSGDRRSLDTARILVVIQASRTRPNPPTTP
jgi:hypothetical protein